MIRPKAFYFFYYAAYAALLPFLVVYFERLGFSGQQIGILGAIIPLMVMLAAPFWANLVDSSQSPKNILISLMILGIISGFSLSFSHSFWSMLALMAVFAFVISPVMPLGDNVILRLLGEAKKNYGRLRVWGAIGWGISAPIVGFITERLELHWAFYCFALFMFLCLLSVAQLPMPSGKPSATRSFSGFMTPPWMIFLLAMFMAGACLALCGNFIYLYLTELKAKPSIIGLALSFATLSELPITFFGKQLLERFTTKTLILSALSFLALRLVLYSLVAEPVLILFIQLLHGLCFSMIWIAGVNFADEFSPEGKTATAQSLFSAVILGLGSTVGSLAGGYFYDLLGPRQTFLGAGLVALVAVLLVFSLGSSLNSRQSVPAPS